MMIGFPVTEDKRHKYIALGPDHETPIVLLHGLFGTASNFNALIDHFSSYRRVLMPILPIFEMSLHDVSVSGLVEYLADFINHMELKNVHLVGNSLGGHIALLYTLKHKEKVKSVTLTGSSGLYENAFGTSFPRREDKQYLRKKIEFTFYNRDIVTDEMVDEIYEIVNDRGKGIRIVKTAKSAIRHNMENKLHLIKVPTLLVWGVNDTITPPFVGEKFHEILPISRLEMIDKCGHAPMLEHPKLFNQIFEDFINEIEDN